VAYTYAIIQCVLSAVEVAQKAVELNAELWQSHYWYALAIGSQVRHQGIQKKIVGGYEYKVRLLILCE